MRARRFRQGFPGRVLYAVKCNPDVEVLQALHAGGIEDFDVASLTELRQVRAALPHARLHFMHPIKAPEAIAVALRMGVQTFVVDQMAEWHKILDLARDAPLLILVRLAVSTHHAQYPLNGKFGASADDAVALLRAVRRHTPHVGVCFHVGSQCLDPQDYAHAIDYAIAVARRADVPLDVLDVGGGFPSRYPGSHPPPDTAYFDAITQAIRPHGLDGLQLWAEPGRALVADGGGLLVRVEARRGDTLHLNDGLYGALHDAARLGWPLPVRTLKTTDAPWIPFRLFGPSCDSADVFQDPVCLPADVQMGDWLEFGQLGAYGTALGTRFNGFAPDRPVHVLEHPLIDRPPPGAPWSK